MPHYVIKSSEHSIFHLNSQRSTSVCIMNGRSLFRGRIPWMGTISAGARKIDTNPKVGLRCLTSIDQNSHFLAEKAINSTTGANTKNESRRLNVICMNSRFPFSHRLLSTSSSSRHSGSKFPDEKKDDITASSTANIVNENSEGKSRSAQVMDVDEKTSGKRSFQSMLRQYGKVFIATYMAVYISTVLGLFASVQSGQLDVTYMMSLITGSSAPSELGDVAASDTIKEATSAMNDLVKLLESYAITRPVAPLLEQYPWTANFAIAWIATKFTEPIRFGVTVAVTPPLSKIFGNRSNPAVVKYKKQR